MIRKIFDTIREKYKSRGTPPSFDRRIMDISFPAVVTLYYDVLDITPTNGDVSSRHGSASTRDFSGSFLK